MLREIRCSWPNDKQGSLRLIKNLLQKQEVRMQLWENSCGDLFILLNTTIGYEKLMVQTNEELLMDFFGNQIGLTSLVDYSPSPFALLVQRNKLRRLYLPDAEVSVAGGDAYFFQLNKTVEEVA